jgi:streptogramin lyase
LAQEMRQHNAGLGFMKRVGFRSGGVVGGWPPDVMKSTAPWASLCAACASSLRDIERAWITITAGLLLACGPAHGDNLSVSTIAGQAGQLGSADGVGDAARFLQPSGVAVDNAGNVYVADTGNDTIRKITPKGTVSTLAGQAGQIGNADGVGSDARFWGPADVAVDNASNVYVADSRNSTIRKITPDGSVSTFAGRVGQGGDVDGVGSGARFDYPLGVAVDRAGVVYVADTGNNAIRRITPEGAVSTVVFRVAGGDDTSRFSAPSSVAVDNAGNIFVADTGNNTIREITPDGWLSTIAGQPGQIGTIDGLTNGARFWRPSSVAVADTGNIYVADTWNDTIRKITPGGGVSTVAGLAGWWGSADGSGSAARFYWPEGVAVDRAGNVYVADQGNATIRKGSAGQAIALSGIVLSGDLGFGQVVVGGSARQTLTIRDVGTTTLTVSNLSYPAGFSGDWSAGTISPGGSINVTVRFAPLTDVTYTGSITVTSDAPSGSDSIPVSGTGVTMLDFRTLAGQAGEWGSADGEGDVARFYYPSDVAVDRAGNVYVADMYNDTLRKITPNGRVSTLVGQAGQFGSADGVGSAARLGHPTGVAVDSAGNVYVADGGNNTIRKITPEGTVSTLAGQAGRRGNTDGVGSVARFWGPAGIAVENAGDIYIADTWNNAIRKLAADGTVSTLGGADRPSGVAVDSVGNVYVADTDDDTIQKIAPEGTVSTVGGQARQAGSAEGAPGAARFNHPSGVAVDSAGNLYVADTDNATIREGSPAPVSAITLSGNLGFGQVVAGGFAERVLTIDSDGTAPLTVSNITYPPGFSEDWSAGTISQGGSTHVTVTFAPKAAAAYSGNLIVASGAALGSGLIPVSGTGTTGYDFTTLAGQADQPGGADGVGAAARFWGPKGVTVDRAGNIYVADTSNETIRKITPDGAVSTVAGQAGQAGSADGVGAAGRFRLPLGVAVDRAGNLYVADSGNNTIRKITPEGTVSTLAGQAGQAGNTDGVGEDARFWEPFGVAVDSAGSVYVADYRNDTIRRITPEGIVSTLAGQAGQPGSVDGVGGTARFNAPTGVAVDRAGNVYVADNVNDTIRKITPEGTVSTLAGQAHLAGSVDGVGPMARFNDPEGVAVDSAGNVYVADTGNDTVRKITPEGTVSPLAGQADRGGGADGVGGAARFLQPSGVAVDLGGKVYVADRGNNTVRIGLLTSSTAPRLRPSLRPNGDLQGTIAGVADLRYAIQTSIDLTNWSPLLTVTISTNGTALFDDSSAAGFSRRFYRAVSP